MGPRDDIIMVVEKTWLSLPQIEPRWSVTEENEGNEFAVFQGDR
jgi:hypothetical protein